MRRLEFRQRYLTDIGNIAVVISVIAMIGDGPLKICQTNKNILSTFAQYLIPSGFTIMKNPPTLIQIPPTIFHPTLGNN
jgi:hypothetical protein